MLDAKYLFSEAQAVVGTANSTNDVDLGALTEQTSTDAGTVTALSDKFGLVDGSIWLVVAVQTGFTTGANTITTALHDSADDSTYAITEITSAAIATSALTTAGTYILRVPLPKTIKRYLRLIYTCSATVAAGKINAHLEFGTQHLHIGG